MLENTIFRSKDRNPQNLPLSFSDITISHVTEIVYALVAANTDSARLLPLTNATSSNVNAMAAFTTALLCGVKGHM
jgi:hypothetical protein